MAIDRREELAYQFAQDATKQLMTLATGLVALTVTFSKDYLGRSRIEGSWLAIVAWICLVVSVACGQWTLMALTGSLESGVIRPGITFGANVRLPSVLQVITFLAGLVLTISFAVYSS